MASVVTVRVRSRVPNNYASMMELVDILDLKSRDLGRSGSSPLRGTKFKKHIDNSLKI